MPFKATYNIKIIALCLINLSFKNYQPHSRLVTLKASYPSKEQWVTFQLECFANPLTRNLILNGDFVVVRTPKNAHVY